MFYVCSMTAPPVLTAERIDAMLSIMAEVCLESVVEAGQRQKAAEDFEAFERAGRTLQRACRNLRQTIALKQRFDREEARKADDARKMADVARVEADRERRSAVTRQETRVRRHFERVLWDEYDDDEAQALFDDMDERLGDLLDEPDFLDTPAETLIRRLADQLGLAQTRKPRKPPAKAKPAAKPVSVKSRTAPPTAAAPPESPEAPEPPESSEPPEPAQAVPPEPPPEPWPEPYIPPWERLRPGECMPGGTGW